MIKKFFPKRQKAPVSNNRPESGNKTKAKLPNAPIPRMQFSSEMPVLAGKASTGAIRISVVLIVYKMADQAEKTLYSLCADYQQGVTEEDYEIIVVENKSDQLLGEERALQYGRNVRYFCREESLPSPVPAINFGAALAEGSHICIMIDGARMVTPGLISYMCVAAGLSDGSVISVPGYHLGPKVQQRSILEGYNESVEAKLLQSINWPNEGYRLFEIACLSGSGSAGFFKPMAESNCICVPAQFYVQLGGYDEAFVETGGGQVNLDFYKRCVEHEDSVLFTLLGEGSFHQLHGGVTTGTKGSDREQAMINHFAEYAALRGGPYCPPSKRTIFLGAIPDSALRFVRHGANAVIRHNDLDEVPKKMSAFISS